MHVGAGYLAMIVAAVAPAPHGDSICDGDTHRPPRVAAPRLGRRYWKLRHRSLAGREGPPQSE